MHNPDPSGAPTAFPHGQTAHPLFTTYLPALLFLVFFLTCLFSAYGLSPTADEDKHYRYGLDVLSGNSNRFDDSKMPVSALNALPARLADALPEGALQTLLKKFLTARMMTTLFSCLVGLAIFSWARAMYGPLPGLAALALYLFDPNILAHSSFVTTDIYAAGTLLFAAYALWRFSRAPSLRNGLLFAVLMGLSLLAKYTAIVLLPLFALTYTIHAWPARAERTRRAAAALLGRVLAYSLAVALVCVLVLNLGFLFNRSFMRLADYDFQSVTFKSLKGTVLGALPIPTPYPFLQGLDLVFMRDQTNFGRGRIYLLGHLSNSGIPGYYLVDFLLKEPLASQLLLAAALAVFVLRRRFKNFRRDELFLFVPIVFFGIYFNFFYSTQIGIRYYLVIFPLLFIFTGGLLQNWSGFERPQKAAVLALFAWLLISTYSNAPFFLSYTNEIVSNPKIAYKYLADSNLDWEQGKYYLDAYMADHPQAQYEPKAVKAGYIVVSINHLVGVLGPVDQYAWLRDNFRPVDVIAGEYAVFDISPAQIAELCLPANYCSR